MIAGGGVLALAAVLAGPRRGTSASWAGPPTARPSLLLVGVLAVGLSANGATRWIAIGSFTFQPSELAKLGLLLVLAAVLGSSRPAWQRFALAVLLAVVPIGLTLLQPDLSTTMLLAVLAGSMLVIGRVPARFLLPLAAAAVVSAPLMISLLRPYQVERLGSFLVGAHESPTGSGWAAAAGAHRAWAPGALFGRTDDPLRGLRAQYLPERDTDLALASLVGQWGLVAGAGAVLAAIVLVWRLALASRASRTPHGALVGGGLAILMGARDRRLGRRQPRAAPAGRRPVPAAQLRRNGARRAPGRDRGRPGRPPGRRPQAAVGAAAMAQPAAAAGPAGRARPVGAADLLRGLRMAAADHAGRGALRSSGRSR